MFRFSKSGKNALWMVALGWLIGSSPVASHAAEAREGPASQGTKAVAEGTFAADVEFLRQHTDVVVIASKDGAAQVALCPKYQGRVMTSTATGLGGLSFGWINRELIASGKTLQHMNPLGGEDRFWMGPEGGQFSIFFAKGAAFDLEHWFTPAPLDTEAYNVASKSDSQAVFQKMMQFRNYSDTEFKVSLKRAVDLYDAAKISQALGLAPAASVKAVAYGSSNEVTSAGDKAWDKATGLLSVWILGMFNPSPRTTIVIPFETGPESEKGAVVNDAYFGKVPADRLIVKEKEGVLFFSGDGKYRSKIGLNPKRAKPFLGSYDAANKVLTIVHYTKPQGATDYVNSMWQIQDKPFAGDVVNSYNDGPPSPGAKPLGPFYELETSSPALALEPGKTATHVHETFHFQGAEADLDPIATKLLGASIEEIKAALKK
ncbi:MAG: hypothetical protein NTW86_19815 [Candidatus Sumerlaeota bacterium]|nr:hypothetical protein [Candidatus Sumerlaeota bacterium]